MATTDAASRRVGAAAKRVGSLIPIRFRLQHLLLAVTAAAIALAALAALRGRVAREQAALHEAQMMGASYSRLDPTTAFRRWLDTLAGGPTHTIESLSFQNQDDPYESWGPYGPGGRAAKLHAWTPETIDRLSVALEDAPFLINLSFWHTTLPRGSLPKLVHPSQRLVHLNLEETNVSDEDLLHVLPRIPNLQRLVLSSTEVTDAVMGEVARLKNLKLLHLENTRITDAGLAKLRGLPIAELNLGLTRVTEESIPLLAELQVTDSLLLPAEWSPQAVKELDRASPPKCDVRHNAYRWQDRPDAKALHLLRAAE